MNIKNYCHSGNCLSGKEKGSIKVFIILFIILIIAAIALWENYLKSAIFKNNNSGNNTERQYENNDNASQKLQLPVEIVFRPVKKNDKPDIEVAARSAFVIDDSTGVVLYEKDSDKKTSIASLTKIATAMTVLEMADGNLDKNRIEEKYDMNKIATVKDSALKMEGDSGLLAGEKIKVRDLMTMMLVASSNDAAEALAEDLSESAGCANVGNFIEAMNMLAKKEELADTHFSNPTGLDDADNYSTAQDVAKLTRIFLKLYPDIFGITKIQKITVKSEDGKKEHYIENTDKLLGEMPDIVAGKTGYTDNAGESLLLVVKHPVYSSRIIAVVIGATDRFSEMKKLVNWVWESYEWR